MSDGKPIADLMVRVGADTGELRRGLKSTRDELGTTAKLAKELFSAFVIPAGVIASITATVDKLAEMGEQALKTIGPLQDQADQLGVTAERLQELHLLA